VQQVEVELAEIHERAEPSGLSRIIHQTDAAHPKNPFARWAASA